MLKSCKHCGRVHDGKLDCGKKPKRQKPYNDKNKFRSTHVWHRKREHIKQRDLYLCQICIRNIYDTHTQYNHEGLEVHHAVPLEVDFEKRLDDDNLLTGCCRHHKMMDSGEIPLDVVLGVIKEQERRQ